MKRNDRRGLSPVIASVMLILLVLVLAALIFLWGRGFVSEQIEKFGKPIEGACSSVNFEIEYFEDGGQDYFEVVNYGNVDIYNLEVRMSKGGDSDSTTFKFDTPAGGSKRGQVDLEMEGGGMPDEITVYPILIGNVRGKNRNGPFACMDVGTKVAL
jgi:flagellin-like protein